MASISAASLTLRATKGSPLTNAEVDANFTSLNTAVQTGQTAASYTAADVLSKLNTVTGPSLSSGLNADTLSFGGVARSGATLNTANTVVVRGTNGDFAAGTITANLTGNASTATALSATLGVAAGGTGAVTAAAARTNLGLAIGTDVQAFDPELAALAGLTSAGDSLPFFTGAGTAALNSFPAYGRSLVAAPTANVARSVLGVIIGTDVQPFDAGLSAVSALSTNGILVRTGAGTAAARVLVAGSGITVTNGDGIAGNPVIAVNSLATANFSIVELNGALLFKYGNTTIGSLSSTGAFTVISNVTAFGTP